MKDENSDACDFDRHRQGRDQKFRGQFRMRVLALRIGLPDFDQAIRHRLPIAIKNAPFNFDYFSSDTWASQIVDIKSG